MKLRTGVDLIEIARIGEVVRRHGRRYLERVYTPAELTQSQQRPEYLAGRFAAKEAVAKALGTGIGQVGWREIEILGDDENAPLVNLTGAARRTAENLGVTTWSVTISHSAGLALAFAAAVGP